MASPPEGVFAHPRRMQNKCCLTRDPQPPSDSSHQGGWLRERSNAVAPPPLRSNSFFAGTRCLFRWPSRLRQALPPFLLFTEFHILLMQIQIYGPGWSTSVLGHNYFSFRYSEFLVGFKLITADKKYVVCVLFEPTVRFV